MSEGMWESDDASAFELPGDAALLARTAAATEEPPPAEPEPAEEGRPRDDKGRFVASEEATEEPEAPAPEEPAPDPLASLLAKYSRAGEEPIDPSTLPEAVRKTLEGALEAQRHVGEREREIGTLREQAARAQALEAQFAQLLEQTRQPEREPDWDTLLDENPAQAARLAYEHGQRTNQWQHWYRAAENWDDHVPGASEMWVQQKQLLEQSERLSQYLEQQVTGQKVGEVSERLGGIDEEKVMEIARDFPTLLAIIQAPGMPPEAKAEALGALELIRRGLDTGTLAEQVTETARKLAHDEQVAAEAASVVSATRTQPQQPETLAGSIAADWGDDEAKWNRGWNIG